MIARILVFAVLLSCVPLFAQSTPPQPPQGGQTQTGAGTATTQRPPQAAQRQYMRQMMQQQLVQFKSMLNKMQADAAKLQDPAGKQVAQDNIDMWQALISHIENMAGPGMHGMMGPGMRGMGPGANPPQGPRGMGNQGPRQAPATPATPTPPKQQ